MLSRIGQQPRDSRRASISASMSVDALRPRRGERQPQAVDDALRIAAIEPLAPVAVSVVVGCDRAASAPSRTSRSASAFDSRSRSASAVMRAASGGTIAASRSSGSGWPAEIAARPRPAPWIASMPHFSLSGSTRVSTPACRIHSSARDGSGADKQLLQLAPRRARPKGASSPSFSRAQARSPSASGRPAPYQAKKRKKRRMRR